jgi:hypothetical protein
MKAKKHIQEATLDVFRNDGRLAIEQAKAERSMLIKG